MSTSPWRVLVLAALLGLGSASGVVSADRWPCLSEWPELGSRLSANDTLLVGRVVGYTEPLTLEACEHQGPLSGLIVDLEGVPGGRQPGSSSIELYPYGLGCGAWPRRTARVKIEALYPVGTRVRALASMRDPCSHQLDAEQRPRARLFTGWWRGEIALVDADDPDPATEIPFEYIAHRPTVDDAGDGRLWRSNELDPIEFEVLKDVMRLAEAPDDRERASVMRRLMALPRYRGRRCEWLVRKHFQTPAWSLQILRECRVVERFGGEVLGPAASWPEPPSGAS